MGNVGSNALPMMEQSTMLEAPLYKKMPPPPRLRLAEFEISVQPEMTASP